ncbi:hypothetical protein ACN077_12145 [Clostridium chromiireducens]|uniref:hypothetical protein n=1 Tax=Clostridium chromiireducens TaxID=225345 RepID=UPI003AF7F99E
MNKKRIKELEEILIKYKTIDLKLENIEDRMNVLMEDIKIVGVSYEQKGSPTNSFSSNVENEVIRRAEQNSEELANLAKVKNELLLFKNVVYRALNTLTQNELDIITMRYLHKEKKSWVEIGMILGFEKDYCCKKRKSILTKLEPMLVAI